jgi:P-type E1-E2 ATPase
VARTLGIDRCIAEVLPEEKADVIIDLKKNGHIVAFVGDGINDSVGLSYADIGISVRGGADITKETAGVILLDDEFGEGEVCVARIGALLVVGELPYLPRQGDHVTRSRSHQFDRFAPDAM